MILVPAATFGPLPSRERHQVERPGLVHAQDDFGLALPGHDLAVGDRAEVFDAGLLAA